MSEKITKETLEKYGFVKDYEYNEYYAEQEKKDGIERFLLEGQDLEEPVRCFTVQGVWMCLALKAVLSIDRHPLISEYEVRTEVDTIEDIQNAMKCAHIGRVLELKQARMTKEEVKAEIKRLKELLARMEEEEKLDFPHKQLDLFQEND